jgi:hypothetical protein
VLAAVAGDVDPLVGAAHLIGDLGEPDLNLGQR